MKLLCSSVSRAWMCADRFDVDEDNFDVVLKKVLVFRFNTDEVSLVR